MTESNGSQPKSLFGTDGVRGRANAWPITPEVMTRLAMASGKLFQNGGHKHSVVIGKDTRLSGYMVENALTSGFVAMGLNVILLGPIPTPAVGMLTRSLRADIGVMISASHNPYYDNGVKFFGPDGFKLSDAQETEIEKLAHENHFELPETKEMGKAYRLDDAIGRYIEFVKFTFPRGQRLEGLKIVVDCANGAAYKVAPAILWELGAEIIPIADNPDGFNINENCGATHVEPLCQAVLENNADLGIALDGDADRLIMVDEKGQRLDGDHLMALIATHWHRMDRLNGGGVVATQMSNLGLERFLEKQNLKLHRTQVGDRYVVEAMRAQGFNVGGEQSGHIILSDYTTTGDGLIAALQVLSVLKSSEKPASAVHDLFENVPQVLKSVQTTSFDTLQSTTVRQAIEDGQQKLSGFGRLFIRPSGTEPKIRVMAEGDNQQDLHSIVDEIIGAIQSVKA